MFIVILFTLNALLFAYILFYGACMLALPFVRPLKEGSEGEELLDSEATVAVLVPCHYEGQSILATIDSLVAQDYPGQLNINVLLKDDEDSSIPFLRERYPAELKRKQKRTLLLEQGKRRVYLHRCGVSPKREKLNLLLPNLEEDYVAFLDADHRANPAWISRSIAALAQSEYAGVQSRRAPLSLERMPQLWDSAQNHIGNELVNRALKKVVGSVFFTGTTCVFRRAAIEGQLFGDCVTEDTWFSYELLTKGQLIDYLPETGSREEVAPDVRSYIARRRRWSCGHNKTFFSLGPRILRSAIPWRKKAATAVHGLFYTVPVVVCFLLNIFALHLFVQFTPAIQTLTILAAAGVSYLFAILLFGWHRSIRREFLALFSLLLPQTTFLTPIALYQLEHQLYYFLTSFPYIFYIFWSHLFCLAAPLLLLILGHRKIDVLSWFQVFLIWLSYPIFFLLDLYSCILGFVDYLFGKPTWTKIQRTHRDDAEAKADFAGLRTKVLRWGAAAGCALALFVAVNDLSAYSNCGQVRAYLYEPIFFAPSSAIDWDVSFRKSITEDERLSVQFQSSVSGVTEWQLEHFLDGEQLRAAAGDVLFDERQFSIELPLGWEAHEYSAKLRSGREFCDRTVAFDTTYKELRDNKLYVNNEEFLIKGVIPSISPTQTEIEEAEGYKQIKALGANTLRLYHSGQSRQRDAAEEVNLLLINQPNRSTWDDVNLLIPWDRILLQRRFKRLFAEDRGNPQILFHTLGNELEIRTPRLSTPKLLGMIEELSRELETNFYSYSTFFVFLRLPSAILGVNMLDSGATYWKSGMESIRSLNQPFFASEFGGFVAAFERTPPELRAYRVLEYAKIIEAAGGMGIVIHQSHDNWSQPVIDGFNDPFSADQPDDERGIWTRDNRPKLIKRFVEQLFADVELSVPQARIAVDATEVKLRVRNRRNYALRELKMYRAADETLIAGPLDLAIGETTEILLPLSDADPALMQLRAEYHTHQGLPMQSRLEVRLPLEAAAPLVLNDDLIEIEVTESEIRGRLLRSEQLAALLPADWNAVRVNGQILPIQEDRLTVPLPPAMESVHHVEGSVDGQQWYALDTAAVGRGPQRVRFKLAREYPRDALLLLAGLGTERYHIRYGEGEWQERSAHKYRENIVPLKEVIGEQAQGEYLYLLLPRFQTEFIAARDHPEKKQVDIELEVPRVFSPPEFVMTKAELSGGK